MKKNKAMKFIYIAKRIDDVDQIALSTLLELIRKNRDMNGGLWVSDWRTASSHQWKATYRAEVERRFGLPKDSISEFMHYLRHEEVIDDLSSYQHIVDVDDALRWMYSFLVEDWRFIDKLEYYHIASREDEVVHQGLKNEEVVTHIQNKQLEVDMK